MLLVIVFYLFIYFVFVFVFFFCFHSFPFCNVMAIVTIVVLLLAHVIYETVLLWWLMKFLFNYSNHQNFYFCRCILFVLTKNVSKRKVRIIFNFSMSILGWLIQQFFSWFCFCSFIRMFFLSLMFTQLNFKQTRLYLCASVSVFTTTNLYTAFLYTQKKLCLLRFVFSFLVLYDVPNV